MTPNRITPSTFDSNPATDEWQRLFSRPFDKVAVIEPSRSITVGELADAVRARIGQLIAHGVTQGSRVIVARPNNIEFVVDYLAIRHRGAVVVNLPWSSRNVITKLADSIDASCVILEERLIGDDPVFDDLGATRFRATQVAAPAPPDPAPRGVDDIAWLACTSGTTGRPKAAVHVERTLERQTEVFVEHFQLTDDDPILVASPVGHAVGLLFGVRLALWTGAPMVLVPRWSPQTAADLVDQYECVFTVAPTPFLMDAVDYAEQHGPDQWRSLRYFPSAGAPVPRSLVRRAATALPHTSVWSYFGTSEAGAVTAVPLDAPDERRFGSDGVALPGMETRVVDGELQLKGEAQLALGYWAGDPEERFRPKGWYATGDQATQDHDGYILMAGRAQDVILRGGENISPLEIEEVLMEHPAIADISVVGYPDDRLGARVAAVVVTNTSIDLGEIQAMCAEAGLPKSKWPERMAVTDQLPRSVIGKVAREEIEALAATAIS